MHHDLAAAQRHSPHGRMDGGGELQEPQRILYLIHILTPPSVVYHLTRMENLDSILDDGKISRFLDSACWFCAVSYTHLR